MTGQEFIDNLTKVIMQHSQLDKDYSAADLTKHAAEAGLWYRKPYKDERAEALEGARAEVAPRPGSIRETE